MRKGGGGGSEKGGGGGGLDLLFPCSLLSVLPLNVFAGHSKVALLWQKLCRLSPLRFD